MDVAEGPNGREDIQIPDEDEPSSGTVLYRCEYDGKTNAVCTLVRDEDDSTEAKFGVAPAGAFLRTRGDEAAVQLSLPSTAGKIPQVKLIKYKKGMFCFAGFMHGQGSIMMWYNELSIAFTTDESTGQGTSVKGRLRGFGDACLIQNESTECKVVFRIATGLGIRNFSVLRMDVTLGEHPTGVLRLERFVQCGNFDTHGLQFNESGSILAICQWLDGGRKLRTLDVTDQKASLGASLSEAQLEIELGAQNVKSLLHKFGALSKTAHWDAAYLDHTDLFPRRVLDPEAYDGEVNADGDPHGYGVQLVGRRVYKGYWRNGLCHGKGSLFDESEKVLLFEGEFKNGKREGHGSEVKPGKETFVGNFSGDMRHGFGVLTLLAAQKVASMDFKEGVAIKGFFSQNKLHGLARIYYPKGTLGEMECCSVAAFAHNMCQGEFWFSLPVMNGESRVESCPKSPPPLASKLLGQNIPLLGTGFKFDIDPQCCWVCLEEASGSCKTCACCGFFAHSGKCMAGSACPFDASSLSSVTSSSGAKRPRVTNTAAVPVKGSQPLTAVSVKDEAIQDAMEDMTKIRGKMLECRRQAQMAQIREELSERKKLRLERESLEKRIADAEEINRQLAEGKSSLGAELDLSMNLLVMDGDQLEAHRRSLLKLIWARTGVLDTKLSQSDAQPNS